MSDGKTNKFDVLYSRETVHGLGEYSASLAVEHSYGKILGMSEFYRVLATRKQGTIGREVRDFLVRLVGPVFLG